ncbi:armadillo-type protein [Gorgonomyces haynaldii]|nr:armadillo-type protein [Gorgonomyces haynaldii]
MSVSCSFFYRHATLINNVYPSGPGEEGPKPSALSLLIFYASSKPQKMPKIGAFLEKRVQKDMQKSRFGHVKVSLKILTATMSECQQHTGLISKSVLRIVLMVLQCPDPDVVLEATNTFVLFNSNHNHESVVDEEFGSIYLNLVEKFCAEATSQIGESNIKHKQRLSGLKALESLCDNASFLKRADLSKYMSTIVPALLLNLSDKTSVTKSKESLSPRRLSIQDSLITDDELKNICNHCLDALFSNSNAASAKIILMPLFRDLDDKKQWPNSVYVLRVFKTIFHALKGEYRYVLVAHIFERIKMEPDLAIKTTLVNALRVFMTSGSGLMSLTIPELLETLVSHLAQFCSKKAADPLYENALKESIISAIAALASHPHYPNQVNDVISILTNKIDNPMDDKPMNCDTHVINLLNAISQCLKPPAPEKRRASIIEEFCSIIRHQMYKLVQLDQLEPGDCVIFGRCLRDLMHINNTKELPYSIPLVFQVQNLLTQDNVSISKQRAIGSILIEYLLCVADKFGINDLQEYLLSIKQQRLDALQWYPGVDLSTESLYVMDQRKFMYLHSS